MVKIAFHDNCLCERGTTIAIYDYAYYNRELLKNESVILYKGSDSRNVAEVIEKCGKEFPLLTYNDWDEVDKILEKEGVDILYLIKGGENEGKLSKIKKNIVHCVFHTRNPHGDVYGKISSSIGDSNIPIVNHIVHLPDTAKKKRESLGIPENAIVFGRHGGMSEFNIGFVQNVIERITNENPNIYFLFVNTNRFGREKKNILFLDKIVDLEEKTEFINSCDAMIHARSMGETFGLAVAEFSIKNKPIITCRSGDRAHLDMLKDNCFIYHNEESLYHIFNHILKILMISEKRIGICIENTILKK
jgi:hypothetical protein